MSSSSSSSSAVSSGADALFRLDWKNNVILITEALIWELPLDAAVWFYLISLLRALSWLCSCSFTSCCSSRSLCSFFLPCSSRSISSSASSIWRFSAFRRRFNWTTKRQRALRIKLQDFLSFLNKCVTFVFYIPGPSDPVVSYFLLPLASSSLSLSYPVDDLQPAGLHVP